jgi:hypothetical protein
MKIYNFLYITLSLLMSFFYSLCMEEPQNDKQIIISLITIIKTQQNILGYTPPTDALCIPQYFESFFEIMEGLDPKQERTKIYEQLQHREAITCINVIIYEYPLLEELIPLIIERFGKNSIYFLRKTIEHNEKILKQQQLFDYYQRIIEEKPIPTQLPTIPIYSTKSTEKKQPQEIIEELPQIKPSKKAVKDNEILFTQSTYKRLTYNYQAFLYWDKKDLKCNIYDPFINVAITVFNEDGSVAFNNPKIPLPLPVLIDDKGNIKSEIFLPLSQRPFTVNYKNTEPLQKALPKMALNFYKNIDNSYNENDIEYLLAQNVIQQQGNTYIHGKNSCKPLLEEYFRLWGIPENEYKQIQEPLEQPQEPQTGWFAKLQAGISAMTTKITSLFRNIYRYIFG